MKTKEETKCAICKINEAEENGLCILCDTKLDKAIDNWLNEQTTYLKGT